MPTYGAELPPHLQAERSRDEPSDDQVKPVAGTKRKSPSPQAAEKRRRVMGPAMPPAPLEQRPTTSPNHKPRHLASKADSSDDDDDDDDDDIGPAPPSATESAHAQPLISQVTAKSPAAAPTTKRDEWMIVPPKQDDLAARMDPSRIRARGFNTGKAAHGGGDVDNTAWTETPEQTRQRLADEVLGRTKQADASGGNMSREAIRAQQKKHEDRALAARIEASRGKSLYEQHQASAQKVEEDDPSLRTFDREKDMAIGGALGPAQRSEMLSKSSGFSSKFSGGSFL